MQAHVFQIVAKLDDMPLLARSGSHYYFFGKMKEGQVATFKPTGK